MLVNKEIIVADKYVENIVWGSIDPRTGDIILYPNNISDIIEKNYIKGEETITIKDFHNITLNLKKMYQSTENGFRKIFREDLSNFTLIDKNGEECELKITKEVVYNENYKAWYLNKKTSHIGFLADVSGSMRMDLAG